MSAPTPATTAAEIPPSSNPTTGANPIACPATRRSIFPGIGAGNTDNVPTASFTPSLIREPPPVRCDLMASQPDIQRSPTGPTGSPLD
ncbi:hypothetical protein GCM10009744_34280 [Kribbella alba]|uniref:Uncharacterized protein n=1 Tax=Kribbella alba TaxID=190197 RepID=A0ABP4RAD4_9ACTN